VLTSHDEVIAVSVWVMDKMIEGVDAGKSRFYLIKFDVASLYFLPPISPDRQA
jgi:hypothetical protein